MKSSMYAMFFIVAMVIIFAIIVNTSSKPKRASERKVKQTELPFSFDTQETTAGYWDRVKALNTTVTTDMQGAVVTDENGNPVTDENGNVMTETAAPAAADGQSDNDADGNQNPVTQAPSTETEMQTAAQNTIILP